VGSYFDGSQTGPFAGPNRDAGRSPSQPPASFMNRQTSSFAAFLASHSPGLLPGSAHWTGESAPGGQAIKEK